MTVHRLVAENTLERKVVRLRGHRGELAQSVFEGSDQARSCASCCGFPEPETCERLTVSVYCKEDAFNQADQQAASDLPEISM